MQFVQLSEEQGSSLILMALVSNISGVPIPIRSSRARPYFKNFYGERAGLFSE